MVVGPEENVNRVAEIMGNSVKRLDAPNIATIFIGIMVGIIFGSLPFAIPGMPVPLKLGIAGGPLIIAILIGRFGYRMKLVTYTTTSANMMLRDRTGTLPGECRNQGWCRILGHCSSGRRIEVCGMRFPHHHYSYPHRGYHRQIEVQVQLLHHHGYACRYLYRSSCIGLCQRIML